MPADFAEQLSERANPIGSNLPEGKTFPDSPGEWQIRRFREDGETSLRIVFGCPRQPGNVCGVPLLPKRLPNGAGWAWDGDIEQPTLTPSINCVGGCGWHGFVTKGEIR